jgi:hypothetical protein
MQVASGVMMSRAVVIATLLSVDDVQLPRHHALMHVRSH